jgi:hypothetical protein
VFFELFGPVFVRLAAALEADVITALDDDFARIQLTTVAKTLRDIGTAWPELFAALEAENAVLATALSVTGRRVGGDDASDGDALRRNRTLLAAVAEALEAFDAAADHARLATMRRALMEAAVIEQRLLGIGQSGTPERLDFYGASAARARGE